MRGFTGFEDGKDKGVFPDSGKVRVVEGEIEEGGEVGKGFGTEVFKMEIGEVIRAEGRGVFKEFDSVRGLLDCEG